MIPQHDFLIAIDSDGTAFDTMEIKHKECFIPNIIQHWRLQAVQRQARRAAEFVNLYSHWRGLNRFPALLKLFDLLDDWPEVHACGARIPPALSLRAWIASGAVLNNHTLKKRCDETGDAELLQAWSWSEAINRSVTEMVQGVPPFPYVRASLEKISTWADVIVCSVTADAELAREWREHGLHRYVSLIAGQDYGHKSEIIRTVGAGRYVPEKILMIGDSPVDLQAARDNRACFFPILPGKEKQSWQCFLSKVADSFAGGQYHQDGMTDLIAQFQALLPDIPPWKNPVTDHDKKNIALLNVND